MGKSHPDEAVLKALCAAYPGAWEDHPWGDTVFKVKKKVFCFLGTHDDGAFSFAVKLPHSAPAALTLPFAAPTPYGLGRAGWVSSTFAKGKRAPVPLLKQWLDEGYRAVAPKTLLKQLDAAGGGASKPAAAAKPKRPAAKPAARRKR